MFTREQIEKAHAKVKSGADYPKYIQDLKELGVKNYDVVLRNGSWVFKGEEGYVVTFQRKFESVEVAEQSSYEHFKEILEKHQGGETDYPTFCIQAGESGVEKWITDIDAMTVTYLDKDGVVMTVEPIPAL